MTIELREGSFVFKSVFNPRHIAYAGCGSIGFEGGDKIGEFFGAARFGDGLGAKFTREPADLRGAAAPRPHPLPEIIGRDIRRVAGPEFFPADKLHLKINGRDRAYLARDVASLTFAAYAAPSLGGDEVQVFVYDMQRPASASGMCRHEYAAGAKPVELGDVAYQAGGSVFFAAGPLLVEIVTIGRTQAHQQAVMLG